MERDEVIFRDSFGGLLSVLITLSPGEVTTMQAPAPLLKQVMRGAPLSSLADVVRSHFSNSTTVFNSSLSIWFEDALTLKPLRSDWPCGHVKDLIDYSDQEEHDDLAFETKRRPWHIIVHFKNQPDGALPFSLRNGTDAQKSFFETFKQSTYLRYGSGKPALVLSAEEQSRLWDGLRQASYSEAFVTMSRSGTLFSALADLPGFELTAFELTAFELIGLNRLSRDDCARFELAATTSAGAFLCGHAGQAATAAVHPAATRV
ncbi:MAG: hypothetical protein MHM6MM_000164 [Cercozoa sp. M6MM]